MARNGLESIYSGNAPVQIHLSLALSLNLSQNLRRDHLFVHHGSLRYFLNLPGQYRTSVRPLPLPRLPPTMHLRWTALLPVLSFALADFFVHASPASYDQILERSSLDALYAKRDGSHHHNPHAAPLIELNETEITMYHAPTPPSYYTLDFEDEGYEQRPKGFMIFHGIFMCLAFFVSLPVGEE